MHEAQPLVFLMPFLITKYLAFPGWFRTVLLLKMKHIIRKAKKHIKLCSEDTKEGGYLGDLGADGKKI
jgi:hypothetical protein